MTKQEEEIEGRTRFGLWVGLLGGPILWLLNLQATYSLVPWTCRHGKFFLVPLSSLLFLGCTIAAGFIGRISAQRARLVQSEPDEGMDEVALFMSQLGLWMTVLFALLIVAQAIPTFVLSPCVE
jgi:hypothetical protein